MAKAADKQTSEHLLPPRWDELVGYDETLAAWRRLVASDRLPPVILLTGRAGLGKRSLLAALAAMHVCQTGAACGTCEQCRWVLAGEHPEILWTESDKSERAGGKLLMEAAEAVQDHLSLTAGGAARARIAVIADADELTTQAANRLLKTLEETPPRTRILLSTSRVDALLPTVLSRCVRWRIAPPPVAASRDWLVGRLAGEGLAALAADEIDLVLKEAGLAPGIALATLVARAGEDQDSGSADALGWLTGEVHGQSVGQGEALAGAEAWTRAAGVGAADLLARIEMALNEDYAGGVTPPGAPHRAAAGGTAAMIWRRRATLRQAKALAMRGKVPLNAQLIAERLVLSDSP